MKFLKLLSMLLLVVSSTSYTMLKEASEDKGMFPDLVKNKVLDKGPDSDDDDDEDEDMSADPSEDEDDEMIGGDESLRKKTNDSAMTKQNKGDERINGVQKSRIQGYLNKNMNKSDLVGVQKAKTSKVDEGKTVQGKDHEVMEHNEERSEYMDKNGSAKTPGNVRKSADGTPKSMKTDEDGESSEKEDLRGRVEQLSTFSGDESDEKSKERSRLEGDTRSWAAGSVADEKIREANNISKINHTMEDTESGENDEDTSGNGDRIPEDTEDKSKDKEGSEEKSDDNRKHAAELNGNNQKTKSSVEKADVLNRLVSSGTDEEASNNSGSGSGSRDMEESSDEHNATPKQNKIPKGKKQNVQDLLKDLVPSGVLPSLPNGFENLSDMSTVSFTYDVDENKEITVTSDIKEPLELFSGKITLTDTRMTFSYKNKERKGERWRFEASGKWIIGEQLVEMSLESSKFDDHFTLTGEGESLALKNYAEMFVTQENIEASHVNMKTLDETKLTDVEIYVVYKDEDNLVSLVSGLGKVNSNTASKPSLYKTYIQKFPKKSPVFSFVVDFENSTHVSTLSSYMNKNVSNIPFVKKLIENKGLLKVANGSFGFVASSTNVEKLRLDVFGKGMVEKQLGSHVSAGITLTLPLSFHATNKIEEYDTVVEISTKKVLFLPSKYKPLDVGKALKTLSEFTRPKIVALGYPDVSKVILQELTYDLDKQTFTVVGHSQNQFNIIPGFLPIVGATLEFKQLVPDEFATLVLDGFGMAVMGAANVNISIYTDPTSREMIIEGRAPNLWSADIGLTLGVTMEVDDDIKKILGDNRMLNINIEDARMYTLVKNEQSGLMHFSGFSKPASWNDPIEVEAVVFNDAQENRKKMTVAYLFDKLPLPYAVDAFSFGQFPSPRLLDNSRNTTLVLSPINTNSMFLHPAMNGLSFMRGLSLVGQFRLPDVCSLNKQCESAALLLGTEKWYRIQGLVSSRGYSLAGYIDKDFTLAKGLTLTDNIIEFALGNYSYMSIATALRLHQQNVTFRGYINFDSNGVRLRMGSNDIWSRAFPGNFIAFDRLQIDVPFVSGIPMDEFLITGEMNFGLPGSLYRVFAPAYLTFKPSAPKKVGFQATLSNITMETIINALNFKSTLPDVLLNSRFPETLVAKYAPDGKKNEELELYGKLKVLERTLICKLRIDTKKQITASTSHSKYPLILDSGLITVYADKNRTKLGPRVSFKVDPENVSFKLIGYASFMGLGTNTEIDVSEGGTEFSLYGNLFGVTKTVVSIMSPDGLPENGPYIASACIPEVIPHVVSRVEYLVSAAADQAQGYVKQASRNYQQANIYHQEAVAREHKYKDLITEREADVESDDREWFLAEERYNKTCREESCGRTCIGCTAWHKCCDRDVFGNCVKCPGWMPCCWRGKSPICKAKNHGCRIMKQLAAENLQKVAKRVYADKEKKQANDKTLLESEYLKGKTQAVLDAARRALTLVNHDSQVGLGAARSIKRFGLERLINIQSICFQTTLKTLATSCVGMRINATLANEASTRSIPYYGCLNREIIPKMANYISNYMFSGASAAKHLGKEKDPKTLGDLKSEAHNSSGKTRSSIFGDDGEMLKEEDISKEEDIIDDIVGTKKYRRRSGSRRRRRREEEDDEMEERPFWLIRNNYQSHGPSTVQQRTTVPRSPLRKKWQIPATRKGKCRVYRQLVEICKDMMSTVKLLYKYYEEGKAQFLKRKTELELGLNTTIADLERQASETPELKERLGDIEMNIRTVNAGVSQWRMNCEADQNDQNKIAVQEWVGTMEERIRRLGGQGVQRFLSNLFRAFEGMFLGTDTPKNSAEEVLNTLQTIREISATFHDVFANNDITLEKANSRAEMVLAQLKHIKETRIFCDK